MCKMEFLILCVYLMSGINRANAADLRSGKEPNRAMVYSRVSGNSGVRPRIIGSLASDQPIVGRQPTSFPGNSFPMPQMQSSFPNLGSINSMASSWQGAVPGFGSFSPASMQLGAGSGAWPLPEWQSSVPQMPLPQSGFGQSSTFWPQPSQWPFVDTAVPPAPQPSPPAMPFPPPTGNGMFGSWAQGPVQPGPQAPASGVPHAPWQGPPQSAYSQWLPTSLGSAALPLSPPWNAPGTIVGGPQLGPQGAWPGQPMAHNPPVRNAYPQHSPSYVRVGHDSNSATPPPPPPPSRNGNAIAKQTSRLDQQYPVFEIRADNTEGGRGVFYVYHSPNPISQTSLTKHVGVQTSGSPLLNYQNPKNGPNLELPYLAISDLGGTESVYPNQMARGRDILSIGAPVNDPGHEPRQVKVVEEAPATASPPTVEPADDPYALNPNIVFGGPASMMFPELKLEVPTLRLPDPRNASALSFNSIRIGDILSFPRGEESFAKGTQFGQIPFVTVKKGPELSSRSGAKTISERRLLDAGDQIENATSQEKSKISVVNATVSTVTEQPSNNSETRVVVQNPNLEQRKNRKDSQLLKNETTSVTETILQQIRNFKIVLYSRSNCSDCVESELLLKNYSIPVQIFEQNSTENGDQIWTAVQQITHSSEMPLAFICGRFIGGYQRLYDMHINQQISPLLRACTPSKRRSAASVIAKRTRGGK